MLRYRLTVAAQDDLLGIFEWSQEQFGDAARVRYEALVATALRDVVVDPARAGSVQRPELGAGVRSWHLRLSRERARTDTGVVQRPRHFLIYRSQPQLLVVGRVLHDAMELARHLDASTAWD